MISPREEAAVTSRRASVYLPRRASEGTVGRVGAKRSQSSAGPAAELQADTGYLSPAAPFDFAKATDFLGRFTPTLDEQSASAGSLIKAVAIGRQLVAVRLDSIGSPESPQLQYILYSAQAITPMVKSSVVDWTVAFLGLNDDLRPFYAIGRYDPSFSAVVEQLYGYHHVRYPTAFECACWAILSQRVTLSRARELKHALVDSCGGAIELNGEVYRAFPEPVQLLEADRELLVAAVNSERRAAQLLDAAGAFVAVDRRFFETSSTDELRSWLLQIKGIGARSASLILVRGLGRMERAYLDELRLGEAVALIYPGEMQDEESAARLANTYGPWKGYWEHYMELASELRSASLPSI